MTPDSRVSGRPSSEDNANAALRLWGWLYLNITESGDRAGIDEQWGFDQERGLYIIDKRLALCCRPLTMVFQGTDMERDPDFRATFCRLITRRLVSPWP